MKKYCAMILLMVVALLTQGCSTLDVYNGRNKLRQKQLEIVTERIASGEGQEQLPLAKTSAPVVLFENLTGRRIDFTVKDLDFLDKRPLGLKIGPHGQLILPRDSPEAGTFFRFEETYAIRFHYYGERDRRVDSFPVSAQGSFYQISGPDDDKPKMIYYHGGYQFRKGGGVGVYDY